MDYIFFNMPPHKNVIGRFVSIDRLRYKIDINSFMNATLCVRIFVFIFNHISPEYAIFWLKNLKYLGVVSEQHIFHFRVEYLEYSIIHAVELCLNSQIKWTVEVTGVNFRRESSFFSQFYTFWETSHLS